MDTDTVPDIALQNAIEKVIHNLTGISTLYPSQLELLRCLVDNRNVFLTSPTNSGKTLPPVILPRVFDELNAMGYSKFPKNSRVLFLTALNSIQLSLLSGTENLGIKCDAVNSSNIEKVLQSDASVIFIGPEILQLPKVTRALLKWKKSFVLKVVDEVHLCK